MDGKSEFYLQKYIDNLFGRGLASTTIETYEGVIEEFLKYTQTIFVTKKIYRAYLEKQQQNIAMR
ncbi:TPA: hypothetical protein OXD95_002915, partial [Listeria monocytogenes]|nr:hypothetical protein [Listeria monocytogenes]